MHSYHFQNIPGESNLRKVLGAYPTRLCLEHDKVFSLPYRSVEGLACSLMRLMGLDLPVPDHTQMSRRDRQLPVVIPRKERQEPTHSLVDSTGLKIQGEGEWKKRLTLLSEFSPLL